MFFKAASDHLVEQVDATIHSSSRTQAKPVNHVEFIYNCRTVSHPEHKTLSSTIHNFKFATANPHFNVIRIVVMDGPVLTVKSQRTKQRRQQLLRKHQVQESAVIVRHHISLI
jgi:hypothetical protein